MIDIRDASKHEGKSVSVRGWVYRTRSSGKVVFSVIRDGSGIIQATTKTDSKAFKDASKVTVESSVIVKGKVRKDKRAPGGYELEVQDFQIFHLAEPFPITRDLSEEFLLDVRHLWLRSREMNAALKVRSTVFGAIHEHMRSQGYSEIQPPMFTTAACEGGSTLFEVPYFGSKVYLSQSWQLYAEAMITTIEKLYTVAPSFRAEKSRTRRHVTEFWHAEVEAAWSNMDDMIKVAEDLISNVAQKVAKENKPELEYLGRDPKELKKIKPPFERIKYEEALKRLHKKELKMEWGQDMGAEAEKKLTEGLEKPIFITHFPAESKAFYMQPDQKNPKLVLGFDLQAPNGYGELVGGSERIHDLKLLKQKIKENNISTKPYEWYLDLRKYGTVPHAGFGLGVDRLVSWLCKSDHIRDVIPFPRTINRTTP